MTTSTSLLDLLFSLFRDPEAMASYREDPQTYLSTCGDITPEDLRDALLLLEDSQDADSDREYTSGNGSNGGGNHNVHVPPHVPDKHHGESDRDATVRYLNTYITNNHIDERDTVVDNSVHQQVDTHGGDFDQDIDVDSTVASGDGSVAAGEDIENSSIVSGDRNQVGQGNTSGDGNIVGDDNTAIKGDDNTAAFGLGDANNSSFGDVGVDRGGALSVGDTATGDYNPTGSFNELDSTIDNSSEFDRSFNDSTHVADDSFNDFATQTDVDSHDSVERDVLSHNSVDADS
ncbi:hypothetical protein [Pseudonocardia xinjiangensis]|uniref:Dentin sialophosphoprotein n=1 Tax=Pseudonocardia xinjiangensis TaxID=75289 RepID=A0ABX1RP33_9PSEU|nr:hypothetical protein [Pseudonocardia xinjiangensis]NMH80855.1 hypothetical protein [Pseudonocardia xinjiangensis]